MKLRFDIHYRTEWGQQLAVVLSCRLVDGSEHRQHLVMLTTDGEHWSAETAVLEGRRGQVDTFSYVYLVEDAEGRELRREWNALPRCYAADPSRNYRLADRWRDLPLQAHLYTRAYAATMPTATEGEAQPLRLPLWRKTVLLRVSAPQLLRGQALAVVGSHPALGSWNPMRYLAMEPTGQGDWMLTLNVDWLPLPLEYKYVVVDAEKRELLAWEEGDNRVLGEPDAPAGTQSPDTQGVADGEVLVDYGEPLRLAEQPWRLAGVSVPVFALRSEHSCGVGDLGDLYHFVTWAAKAGMRMVQLLPLNDTTTEAGGWTDSDPYNVTDAFRLHPHYIDLNQLPPLADKRLMAQHRRQRLELENLDYSDYEAVDRVKTAYLRALYAQETAGKEGEPEETFTDFVQRHLHQQLKRVADHAHELGVALMGDLPIGVSRQSHDVAATPQLFCLDQQVGTPPDAQFPQGQNWGFPPCNWADAGTPAWMARRTAWAEQYFDALRLDHVQGYFRTWVIPREQRWAALGHFEPALPLTAGEIELLGLTFRRELFTRSFINDRVVDRLFGMHAEYVRQNFLVRKEYSLYDLRDEVATQQRVYEHFEGKGDENSLWIRDGLCRLVANVLFVEDSREAEMYHPRYQAWQEPVFEALQADEKDAFMRIYNNFFYQRHSMFWGHTGYERLGHLLRSTSMLLCAEDLGLLPDSVEPVLDSLRILTTRIQRMPRQAGEEFAHLDGNPVRSLCTLSTHDMAPLRLWWQQQPEQAQRFYATMLQKQGRAPEQLPAHLAEEMIARHVYSPSMLCVLALQDWLAMDQELRSKNPRAERVNTPGDAYNRWQWRMHLTIEQLMAADRLNQKLLTMIRRSRR